MSFGSMNLTALIDQFLNESKCTTKKEERLYLFKLLGNKQLVLNLLYRGSDHGWNYGNFHTRCDKKGPNLCLFKIKDGDCIGGFTKADWSSPWPHYRSVGKTDAILFNLSCFRVFPSKETGTDIYCSYYWGPCFRGGNHTELGTLAPFNGYESCDSNANKPGYEIPVDAAGKNMLTNQKDGAFTITELEVWEVKYLE